MLYINEPPPLITLSPDRQVYRDRLQQVVPHLGGQHAHLPAGEVAGGVPGGRRAQLPHLLPAVQRLRPGGVPGSRARYVRRETCGSVEIAVESVIADTEYQTTQW